MNYLVRIVTHVRSEDGRNSTRATTMPVISLQDGAALVGAIQHAAHLGQPANVDRHAFVCVRCYIPGGSGVVTVPVSDLSALAHEIQRTNADFIRDKEKAGLTNSPGTFGHDSAPYQDDIDDMVA